MDSDWMPLKNFHEWKNTDAIPPAGEVLVWDMATQTDYKVVFDDQEHCPLLGYSHWRPILGAPLEPINIMDVMEGALMGKKYRRPVWINPNVYYPQHHIKDQPQKDYMLNRMDISANDWIEVK